MAKYRGKYKKCRTCTHVIETLMIMVLVKDTCPNKHMFSGGYMTDKYTCEKCEHFKERNESIENQ